jgi:hypothetical protein
MSEKIGLHLKERSDGEWRVFYGQEDVNRASLEHFMLFLMLREARDLAKTCYDHSALAADSSEVALDVRARFEKWGMR